ncbi:MAG TPA: hybrid sensor histidine kinase/response regulator [Anaerolineales bacterium]|nr:hybrid sensor histidine kinase/response regulator [Anaerolineales bacterium]
MEDKQTILIVDDEPALLMGLAATIRRHGYHVITASNGRDGLQKAKESLPDLILSDVMMPPPNGFELRKMMSLDPDLAAIPFIFLTARSNPEDRVSGIREGADDYITKPFVTEELLARIEAVFRRVKTEQARGREQMKVMAEQDMNKLRHEILQNFHHELRTPLSNILMPLELAANNKFNTPEEQSKFIHIALSNADRLESLVTDLILMSNIDQGNLNTIRQPIDVDLHILAPIGKRLERYKSKDLKFVTDIPEQSRITAPRREFVHALVHLMDNAFKFSFDQGLVGLTVQPGSNGGANLWIRDEGPGIPAELREKVFERFYQVSQGDRREYEGLGVGLTIARAVFQSLKGNVQILDSPLGCVVHAFLPDHSPEDLVYG